VGREEFQTSLLLGKHERKEESIIITVIELVSVNISPIRWYVKTGGKTLNNKKIFHSTKFLLIKFL